MPRREQGVALIFVLLIFAMIAVMATRIVSNLHFNTEKTSRYLQNMQARHYAMGAEQFVAVLLEEDAEQDRKAKRAVDHWYEPWAELDKTLETEDGEITIQTLDDQGRFNLNMLAGKTGKDTKDKLKMLEQLFVANGIDAQLAYRIVDWVDDNQDALPGGAEDNYYLLLAPPYRTGDAPLASVSELRLMDILSPEDFERVLPLVTILPTNDGLNINTVSAEVLRMLDERISESDAKAFVDGRGKDGFADMKELIKHPLIGNKIDKKAAGMVVFKSYYFSVYIKARYRDITYYLHSRLARNAEGKVTVISREIGQYPRWVNTLRESVR
ncbi:type II secretion system minor pseudopilin GspK [Sansalvadorimonas verongulae]|uniref:type II secretion system minor pseudopilin GspK n=1 Tax=Sansalvadorimonas verongulae TaxID=2172824 RepID=UPI0012BC6045|nr:type II secretion system minor pseudopilin GspK [Sansalvadorimonas verongulae]MTI14334.1 general secretion pathway protein GspK [Sansalvadorimonas verongulae]